MNATRIFTTLLAAAAVSGGISVAVAQSATPQQRPAPETDSGAVSPQTRISPAPSPAPAAQSGNMSSMPAASQPAMSEPAAQPTRG